MRITGHPIVFGSSSVDLGGFTETIAPEAVDRTLREESDVAALVNHNSDKPLARTSARTLKLRKNTGGLAADIHADDAISYVADLARVIARGDAIGGSFSFVAIDDVWTFKNGQPHRTVIDMRISEVSGGVTFPAYRGTKLTAARSDDTSSRPIAVTPRTISASERQRRIDTAFLQKAP